MDQMWAFARGSIVRRRDALAAGLPSSSVAQFVKDGRWSVVHRGTYRVGPLPCTYDEALRAALAYADNRAVLSHRAAAWAHGLDGVTAEHRLIELTLRWQRRHVVLGGGIVHSARSLPADQRCIASGFPCTSLARTLVDLSDLQDRKLLVKAYEDIYRRLHRNWDAFATEVRSIAFSREAGPLLELMSRRRNPRITESAAEAWCDDLMWRAGIRADRQVEIFSDSGDFVGRVDFALPRLRVAIEYDGWEFHKHRGVQDRRRWRALQREGWLVAPFTKTDLADETRFIDELRDLIYARERALRRSELPMPTVQLELTL